MSWEWFVVDLVLFVLGCVVCYCWGRARAARIIDTHRVAQEHVGSFWVSTVRLLGTDSDYETIVFDPKGREVWSDRYSDQSTALQGHEWIVRSISKNQHPWG